MPRSTPTKGSAKSKSSAKRASHSGTSSKGKKKQPPSTVETTQGSRVRSQAQQCDGVLPKRSTNRRNNNKISVNSYANGFISNIQPVSAWKHGTVFWTTLLYTAIPGFLGRKLHVTSRFQHWNWITERLILGAIPVVTQLGSSGNHLQQIGAQATGQGLSIGLVVACLHRAEVEGFGLNFVRFATPKAWKDTLGVENYHHCPMDDMGAGVAVAAVQTAVDRIHETLTAQKDKAVYIHCKAGKGRSWMVLMCYLTTYGGLGVQEAIALVSKKRHQVNPGKAQVQFLREFARNFRGGKEVGDDA